MDEMSFIEAIGFLEKSLELKKAKEQKELSDGIMLINIIHGDEKSLNAIVNELQNLLNDKGLSKDNSDSFNPTAGALF